MTSETGRGPSHPLALAVFRTLAYAAVFGYPLTLDETRTYLVGAQATRDDFEQALSDVWLQERVTGRGGPKDGPTDRF